MVLVIECADLKIRVGIFEAEFAESFFRDLCVVDVGLFTVFGVSHDLEEISDHAVDILLFEKLLFELFIDNPLLLDCPVHPLLLFEIEVRVLKDVEKKIAGHFHLFELNLHFYEEELVCDVFAVLVMLLMREVLIIEDFAGEFDGSFDGDE